MASIRNEILIDVGAEDVWDAVRDVGALHTRLVPGFVVNTELVPDAVPVARIVTFGNGLVVKELIVGTDDARRRLAWTVVESDRLTHHNGSMQIHDAGDRRSRAVWIADVLPHARRDAIAAMMAQGLDAMKQCLERGAMPTAGSAARLASAAPR